MVAIPPRPEQVVIERIYAAIVKEKTQPDIYLGRLGASFIGEECVRQIWLDWRGFAREQHEGRMLRLFETGHLQEERIIADLRRAGFSVWDRDEQTGKQFEFSDATGHFVTKTDGILKGMPESEKTAHVLEVKTHNKNSFSGIVKKGIKEGKPGHYAQIQITMAVAKLTRALYVAVCKDDEQFYVERVKEDKEEQKRLLGKIEKLTEARLRPAGISDDGTAFGCKFCGMKAVCTKQVEPLRHCRTCAMCTPGAEGKWVCELNRETLSIDKQRLGCEHYEAS